MRSWHFLNLHYTVEKLHTVTIFVTVPMFVFAITVLYC